MKRPWLCFLDEDYTSQDFLKESLALECPEISNTKSASGTSEALFTLGSDTYYLTHCNDELRRIGPFFR